MARLEDEPNDWALDENNDLIIPIRYTTGIEGVGQNIRVALRMWAGEWFLNLTAGLPLLPTIEGGIPEDAALLGEHFDELKARAAVRREILIADDNVVDVPELRVAFDGSERELTVQFRATTRFGDTPLETEILSGL